MELKMNLTLDEVYIISAALNNDALAYKEASLDYITDREFFANYIESYRQRMELKKRFEEFSSKDDDLPTRDEIIDWIYEHETLAEDFESHFGVEHQKWL